MSDPISEPSHTITAKALSRSACGLTQADVAKRLRHYQSYVAMLEGGERKVDVVEFIQIVEAIGFDPSKAIKPLAKHKVSYPPVAQCKLSSPSFYLRQQLIVTENILQNDRCAAQRRPLPSHSHQIA